jgi:hypothetical protein
MNKILPPFFKKFDKKIIMYHPLKFNNNFNPNNMNYKTLYIITTIGVVSSKMYTDDVVFCYSNNNDHVNNSFGMKLLYCVMIPPIFVICVFMFFVNIVFNIHLM